MKKRKKNNENTVFILFAGQMFTILGHLEGKASV